MAFHPIQSLNRIVRLIGQRFLEPNPTYEDDNWDQKSKKCIERRKTESPRIRNIILAHEFDGVRVTELGDLYWSPHIDLTVVIAGAQLSNGKFVVVSYDGGVTSIMDLAKTNEWWVQYTLDNLTCLPRIDDVGEEHCWIWYKEGHAILIKYDRDEKRWEYSGRNSR